MPTYTPTPMSAHTHAAYNLATGEVLCSTRAFGLRRMVKRANRWDLGNCRPEWIFAHGRNAYAKVADKAVALLKRRGVL